MSFQLDEPEVSPDQQVIAWQQAAKLFSLAAHYAQNPASPLLIMIGGIMGTGKSTLARALQDVTGWALCSSDAVRKDLTRIDPVCPQADTFGKGIYTPQWTSRTYEALREQAEKMLAQGRSVLLDASFLKRTDRQALMHVAQTHAVPALFIECVCPQSVALRRLAQRWKRRVNPHGPGEPDISYASDGRPDLYHAQSLLWEAFAQEQEPATRYAVVRTDQPLPQCIEHILQVLDLPHLLCNVQAG